jgi:hypothetical protein
MNHISPTIHIHLKNKSAWLIFPWILALGPAFGLNFLLAFFLEKPLYTGGLLSIYAFMFILGTMALGDTLPFSLGFSMRRTDYFLGTIMMFVAISLLTAIQLVLFSLVETRLIGGWAVDLHFFSLPYWHDGSLFEQFWTSFSLLMHLYLLGFISSSLYYRFGRTSLYVFFVVSPIVLGFIGFILTRFNWWGTVFGWLVQHSAFEHALWLTPVTVGYALLSYLLLRKANA